MAQNPPPNPGAGLTRETFDKIDHGMTVEAVSALLGKDPESSKPVGNGELTVTWRSDDGKTVIDVSAVDGKVKNKYSSPNWPTVYPSEVAQNPPDKAGPGVTRASFDKIGKGMTVQALADLLGKGPDAIKVTGIPGQLVYTFNGADNRPTIDVTVSDGKVTTKQSSTNWPVVWPADVAQNPPDKPAPGVTQANFDKVAKGMTQTDVEQILGKAKTEVGNGPRDKSRILYWRTDDGKIEIAVTIAKDGKVVEKIGPTGWPVVWPADVAQNLPPDKPGITQANFDKIAKGMNLEDLTKLLGPRTSRDEITGLEDRGIDAEQLWRDPSNGMTIDVFTGMDLVKEKKNGQNWPIVYPADVLHNPKAGPSHEAFDKIDKGMTEDDLVKLLGPPDHRHDKPHPDVDVSLGWGGREVLSEVTADH